MATKSALLTWVIVAVVVVLGGVLAAGGGVYWAVKSGVFDVNPVGAPPRRPNPTAATIWTQDFAAAKEKATRENKDILLSFEGSDWCVWCQRMDQEIFSTPEFLDKAPSRFVLVKLDFPRDERARAQVRDPLANEKLQQQFRVSGYPAVVLTDAQGDALGGINGFVDGGPVPLLAELDKLQQMRATRDKLLADIETQAGAAKLPAAKKALEFLVKRNLQQTAKKHVPNWLELARQFDPKNADGYVEQFYEFDWYYRYEAAPTAQLPELVNEMTEWRKKYGDFKDKERAAFIWMELAKGKTELEDVQGAFQCLAEGLKLQPKDPRTRQQLQNGPLALGLGTGTAFAVSASGHFLTNAHVASGPGKVYLQLPDQKQLFSAKIVGERPELDLALLKIDLPKDTLVAPLPIAGDAVPRRGEEVGAWGYPLGTSFGQGLKLTKGVISGLPEPGSRNMLLLDLRINPGNSGSPLCDAKGNVIGIVTARSQALPGESYGMALPGKELLGFLTDLNMKLVAKPGDLPLAWDEIDRRVSHSVAMVIKARPIPKKGP